MAFWKRKKAEAASLSAAEDPGMPAAAASDGAPDMPPSDFPGNLSGVIPEEDPDDPPGMIPEEISGSSKSLLPAEGSGAENGNTEEAAAPLEIANLQGIGSRAEQQDAFGISPLPDYPEKGLLAVLCDGMGGMEAGGEIARHCVQKILSGFPLPADEEALRLFDEDLLELCGSLYCTYGGRGGATLVLAYIRSGLLRFRCMGDSDLFLLRDGRIYALNEHQTYGNLCVRGAIPQGLSPQGIFGHPQAGALVSFLGCPDPKLEKSQYPLALRRGDVLILCSDGVSGTVSRQDLLDACRGDIQAGAEELDQKIQAAARPHQDNYTAVICKYNE